MTTPSLAGPAVGLALGGGGARGIAHIVVLEAFDDLGIRPVALTGTSMGAIIGAAYAAGASAREIRAHALRVLRNRRLGLGRAMEARVGRFTDLLTRGFSNPVLLDAEVLLGLFCAELIPARFKDLRIPLGLVATDFVARQEIVLRSGPLRDAVAASIAIPGLIRPVMRDGRMLIDGGAVNPLPYDHLFDRAEIVVGCDVSAGRADESGQTLRPLAVMLGASQIMQAALIGWMLRAQPPHQLLRPPVERFRLLDFFVASRILEAADAGKDAIKRELDAVMTRAGALPSSRA
jgi:NTE family protein